MHVSQVEKTCQSKSMHTSQYFLNNYFLAETLHATRVLTTSFIFNIYLFIITINVVNLIN